MKAVSKNGLSGWFRDAAARGAADEVVLRAAASDLGLDIFETSALLAVARGSIPVPTTRPRQAYRPDPNAPRLPAGDTVSVGEYVIPRLALGGMRLVSDNVIINGVQRAAAALPSDPERRRDALLDAIHGCGIRYVDIARGYGPHAGAGEAVLRSWLTPCPPDVLLATKVGYLRTEGHGWAVELTPERIASDVRASVEQLGGVVPLMYLVVNSDETVAIQNRPDNLADALKPIVDARNAGLVRHIGLANVTLDELETLRHEAPIAAVQNKMSLANLVEQRPIIERCHALGIPYVAWGIFNEGKLAPDAKLAVTAKRLGMTPEQLTIALLLRVSPNLVVLPGPSRRETIYACVEGARRQLPDDVVSTFLG